MQSNVDLAHVHHQHSSVSSERAQQEFFAIDDNKDYVTNPGSEMTQEMPAVLNFDN